MLSARACILDQSSTDSRTSRSTAVRPRSSSAIRSSSSTRSISMCIQDSGDGALRRGHGLVTVGLEGRVGTAVELQQPPVTSRRTRSCGWTTRWMPWLWWARNMVTESTRNGMSSVTISTTVWPAADQPCSPTVGVDTCTVAVPCGRRPASRYWLIAAP